MAVDSFFDNAPRQKTLVEAFNDSAADYSARNLPATLLVQKYQALYKYKAKDDDVRSDLADSLFRAAENYLRGITSANGRLQREEYISGVQPLLDALTEPASAPFIPARAPESLADIVIALADRVGKLTERDAKAQNFHESFIPQYRVSAAALGVTLMEYAEKFEEALSSKRKTIKPVGPGKLSQ
ncbi:MAG TPA: hypothetical protein VEF76_11655 [Patescibacteria group bacterium]|nr:hypothetical protein [Patescibacteria group bacterium]